MSKKSRENPSKRTTSKVATGASKPTAKKAAKKVAKAATKSPAKKTAAKSPKPAVKPAAKAVAKNAVKTPVKSPAKATKAPAAKKAAVAKKAPVTKTATPKAPAKAAPKPTAKSAPPPKPAPEKVTAVPSIASEGAKAPAFQLPRDGGATVSLADYAGQKLVIFFYPRASTPGCTKEAIDFTRLKGDFQAANTAVLGVSADPLKAQENFRDKYSLGVPLLSDATQAMLKSYSAWGEKSMYGKIFEGVLRTTVLIDADGTVVKIWRSVKVDGHADAVLEETRRI